MVLLKGGYDAPGKKALLILIPSNSTGLENKLAVTVLH